MKVCSFLPAATQMIYDMGLQHLLYGITFECPQKALDEKQKVVITNQMVQHKVQKNTVLYDKTGDQHYDIVSAFIKSIRGSDPNAAVYWLSRMIEGGEDIKFIARRLVILASEDIGNANPNALLLANATFQSVTSISES